MKKKNRKVLLLSAGAALDWHNGPTLGVEEMFD
jgi:hypothetical protein